MTRRARWVALAMASLLCSPLLAQDGLTDERSDRDTAFEQREGMNVAQQARLAFGSADRKMAQAEKLEEKIAAENDDKKRQKLAEKRDKIYAAAVDDYREGLSYDQNAIEGWAGLGRAYREIGKVQESLLAYAEGMKREGDGRTNFQGWTTTLMDGMMFGNAIAAYQQFAGAADDRAGLMLGIMEGWLGERRQDPGTIAEADLDRLAEWIAAQKQ